MIIKILNNPVFNQHNLEAHLLTDKVNILMFHPELKKDVQIVISVIPKNIIIQLMENPHFYHYTSWLINNRFSNGIGFKNKFDNLDN
jgi:hypothetical protein